MKIKLEHVSKSFVQGQETIPIAKDLNWELPEGQSAAIVGPSGSGKTTILNLIAGIQPLDQGNIWCGERQISSFNKNDLAAWRADSIGLIFQQFHLIPYLTAQENIALGLAVMNQNVWQEAMIQAMNLLESIHMSARATHLPSQLSGGEKQRVAILRAMIKQPSLLLADEPTGNLDQVTGEKVFQLLMELQRQKQCSMILITHDLNLAKRCQSVWTLKQGTLVPV